MIARLQRWNSKVDPGTSKTVVLAAIRRNHDIGCGNMMQATPHVQRIPTPDCDSITVIQTL
jgi:hypothetical protein